MKITSEKLSHSQIKLTLELSEEELIPYLDKAASEISKEIELKGFRPGKAPRDMVEKKVGAQAVRSEAVKDLARVKTAQAIKDENIQILGSPSVQILEDAESKPIKIEVVCAVYPEVKLGKYKGLVATKKVQKINDKDVDKEIEKIRKSRAKYVRVERPAKEGDRIEIDLDIKADKVPIEGGQSKNHPVLIGSGGTVPGFDKELVGLKEGEEKTFKLRFPESVPQKNLANREGEFHVKVKVVQDTQLPDVNDEFAKSLGKFGNVQDLRQKIKANYQKETDSRAGQVVQQDLLQQVVQSSAMEIPEVLIDRELDNMEHEFTHSISRMGMNFEQYLGELKKDKKSVRKEWKPKAEERVKSALVLKAVAETEEISASEEEVTEQVEQTLSMQPKEVTAKVNVEEYKFTVRALIRNRKTLERLAELGEIKTARA